MAMDKALEKGVPAITGMFAPGASTGTMLSAGGQLAPLAAGAGRVRCTV